MVQVAHGTKRAAPGGRDTAILGAVSSAARRFARAESWQREVPVVLQELGEAAGTSRAYVYQNSKDERGDLLMTQTFEWVAVGIRPTINEPSNQKQPYRPDFARYEDILGGDGVICGPSRTFPDPEREDLESEGILSTAFVPIFSGDEWWGFLGLDDCVTDREWSHAEIESLKVAADTLGAAVSREEAAQQLYETEAKFRTLIEQIPAVTYTDTLDEKATTIYISPQIEQMLGYTQEEWLTDTELWFRRLHPDDAERTWQEYIRGRESGEPWMIEFRMVARDGHVVWVREEDVLVRDEEGNAIMVQGVMHDITPQKQIEERFSEAERKYRTLVEQIPAITYLDPVDESAASIYVSPQIETILGCTREEWITTDNYWRAHLHPYDAERVWNTYVEHRDRGEGYVQEYRMIRDDGRMVWIREQASILPNERGEPWVIQGLMHDITDRKAAEEQISFLAYHDKLTGLANRALFEEMIESAMARARRNKQAVAVLYMDLDNFKMVNDSLGHDAGDELLGQVGARLTETTRETDLVARQGGDEFLVLLPDLETGEATEGPDGLDKAVRVAEMMAERIHRAMRPAFTLGSEKLHSTISIGISVFPIDAVDARALLKNADGAMYESKKTAPGSYAIHEQSSADPLTQHSYSRRLRKAVREQRWVLHYQPAVDLATGDMVGVEALLRWRKPRGGLIAPGEFLPIAEEMGLLEIIGEWVLEELCRQSVEWSDRGMLLDVSFNLSPRQLFHYDLAQKMTAAIERAEIDPSRVIVEVAESTALTDPARTERVLRSLRERGIRLAIDDFGTGYSLPARLKQLPVDILKIDQPVIRDLPDDPEVASFAQAVIELSHDLGIVSLAEGIETVEQHRFLMEKGCELGQGYLFSRPVPPAEILELYRSAGGRIVPPSR